MSIIINSSNFSDDDIFTITTSSPNLTTNGLLLSVTATLAPTTAMVSGIVKYTFAIFNSDTTTDYTPVEFQDAFDTTHLLVLNSGIHAVTVANGGSPTIDTTTTPGTVTITDITIPIATGTAADSTTTVTIYCQVIAA
jgi:hypothetical protein